MMSWRGMTPTRVRDRRRTRQETGQKTRSGYEDLRHAGRSSQQMPRGPCGKCWIPFIRWRIPARHGGFREGQPVNSAVRAGPDLKPGGARAIRSGVNRELLFQLTTADPPGNLLL